jgi:hypothetical protein
VEPHVAEVLLAHPKEVRAISFARVKTDKVDARVHKVLEDAGRQAGHDRIGHAPPRSAPSRSSLGPSSTTEVALLPARRMHARQERA